MRSLDFNECSVVCGASVVMYECFGFNGILLSDGSSHTINLDDKGTLNFSSEGLKVNDEFCGNIFDVNGCYNSTIEGKAFGFKLVNNSTLFVLV